MDRIETRTIIRVAFCGLCKAASQVALVVKKPPPTAGDTRDMGSIPVSGRFPGERNGNQMERCEELRPWQRSWGRRLGIRKGGIEPQESPWIFSSIYPQNQSLPTLLLCALTSDFLGAVPHHHLTLSEKRVNLQLQLIKFLGIRSV